uniref:Bradykinin-like peptide AR-10 n=1 Tax=Ascaphus truei TaxID=8439 RepID=BRK10_ASCTR|nr:RecName: Full=Bradykinin-like peptide AR-10 [Ascaphus truei]
APVPGLSPFR